VAQKNIRAGRAEIEIGISSRIAAGAKQVSADLKKLGGSISATGRSLLGIATAAAAPLAGMTLSFASAGDRLDKMSKRTGVGVKALSELAFAAEQSGASLDSVEKGIRGMQRSLLNAEMGSKAASDALASLGLSADQLSGMNPEDQFTMIADAIARVEDPSKRAALSMQLFGRAGSELLPMFQENAKGIADLRQEANELGRTMTEEDAKSAAELTDAMNRVKSTFIGVKNQIGAALAPAMTYLSDLIARTSAKVVPLIRENQHLVKMFAAGAVAVGGLGAALVTIGGVVVAAGVAVGGLATVLGVLFSPIGLAIGGVAALGTAMVKYFDLGGMAVDALQKRFGPLVTDIKKAISAITEALKAGDIEKAWEIMSETLEIVWLDMTDEIRAAWLSMLSFILKTGDSIAGAIGKVFQGLATVLEKMMNYYISLYDTIYNKVIEAGGALSGVRTIGAPSSGFQADFGGVGAAAEGGIEQLRQFGEAMEDDAAQRRNTRDQNRQQDQAERDARRQVLADQMDQHVQDAKLAKDKNEQEQQDLKVKIEASEFEAGAVASAAGPSGTFSAFGAALIGAAPTEQRVSDPALLKEQREANKLGRQMNQQLKRINMQARFAG
jgi:hypothetical protein